MTPEEKNRESHLRRLAHKQGYRIQKSRAAISDDNQGGYRIVKSGWIDWIAAGDKYDMHLEDIENYLDYKKYHDPFASVAIIHGKHTLHAWEYYKKVYESIPCKHRLKILIDEIYSDRAFDIEEFFEYLEDILENETQDQFDARISAARKRIGHLLKEDMITIYRGVTEKSLCSDDALSWTYDKDVARWFALRFVDTGITKRPQILTAQVHVSDILDVLEDTNEKEVVIVPPNLCGFLYDEQSEDISYDKEFMQEFLQKRAAHQKELMDSYINEECG